MTAQISWTRPTYTTADLEKPEGAFYDEEAAEKAVKFFGILKLVEGKGAGEKWNLAEWQEYEIIRPLFGWKRKDGTRLYRSAWIEIPRKNGKTTLSAGIALYGLVADGEVGGQIILAARDRLQASLCFQIARKMVDASPALSDRCRAVRSYIEHQKSGSIFRAISGESQSAHGLNCHFAIIDEVHAHKNRELWDVLSTSVGSRRQPLVLGITTAGVYDPNSIAHEQHDYTIKVAEGHHKDTAHFGVIYSADRDEDWRDPKVWRKTNPSLGLTVTEEFLKEEAQKAIVSPARQTMFRQLYLNVWTRERARWLDPYVWDEGGGEAIDIEAYKGRTCYLGLDLSSTTDLSACVALFPEEDGSFSVLPTFWLPEQGLEEKERRENLPWTRWAKEGYLTTTPGNVIDYDFIQKRIEDLADMFNVVELAYDPWNATGLITKLTEKGLKVAPTRQGFATMTAPTKELERLVMIKGFHHANNPILRTMVDGALTQSDPAGNIKVSKATSVSRVDGIVASIMALNSAMLTGAGNTGRSVYEDRGMVVL